MEKKKSSFIDIYVDWENSSDEYKELLEKLNEKYLELVESDENRIEEQINLMLNTFYNYVIFNVKDLNEDNEHWKEECAIDYFLYTSLDCMMKCSLMIQVLNSLQSDEAKLKIIKDLIYTNIEHNDYMRMKEEEEKMTDEILDIITEYCEKYDIDLENFCGEQIYQSDDRRDATMEYFVKILKVCTP